MVSVSGIIHLMKSISEDVVTEIKKWWSKRKNRHGVGVFMIFVVILALMFNYQATSITAIGKEKVSSELSMEEIYKDWVLVEESSTMNGYVNENSQTEESITISEVNLAKVVFVLSWEDEPDHDFRHENTPDELYLSVESPDGEIKNASGENPQGGKGCITIEFEIKQQQIDGANGTGDWNITVGANDCGDHMPKRIGIFKFIDDGNDWSLEIKWKYYTKEKKK